MALENNSEFFVLRKEVEQAAARIVFERGPFAPKLVGTLRASYTDFPADAASIGFEDELYEGQLAIRGKLLTGLDYSLEWNALHRRLDSISTLYSPFQSTTVQLVLTQPLLRGAWLKVNRAPLVIAELRQQSSKHRQQARAMQIVAEVELSYWNLVLALRAKQVLEGGLRLSEQQLKEARTQLRLGSVAQIDVAESESAVARNKDQIQEANQAIAAAESRLSAVIHPDSTAAQVVHYLPSSDPDIKEALADLQELLKIAETNRPDIAAARAELEAAETQLLITQNGLWPSLNIIAGAGVSGASGTLSRGPGTASFNRAIPHGITGEVLDPILPDPAIEGDLGRMFRNLEHPRGFIGLQFEIPLDNSEAVARNRIQEAELAERRSTLESSLSRVRSEVVAALDQYKADLARIEASAESLKLSEKLLDGQKLRFKNGVGVSFDVLRASSEVTAAKIAELRARINGRISRSRLSVAIGTYLSERGIEVSTPMP